MIRYCFKQLNPWTSSGLEEATNMPRHALQVPQQRVSWFRSCSENFQCSQPALEPETQPCWPSSSGKRPSGTKSVAMFLRCSIAGMDGFHLKAQCGVDRSVIELETCSNCDHIHDFIYLLQDDPKDPNSKTSSKSSNVTVQRLWLGLTIRVYGLIVIN